MMLTVCYKTKVPVIYNKGTKWEKQEDTFLAYYSYKTREELQKEVDAINAKQMPKLPTGEESKINERTYFIDDQELFEN